MKPKQEHWGLLFFILSLFLIGGAFGFIFLYPPSQKTILYTTVLPWTGLCLGIVSFFLGHFSYPRIHNLKVYCAGYLAGIIASAYFLNFLFGPPMEPRFETNYINVVYILIALNVAFLSLIPSFVKYRITTKITWSIAALEIVILLMARFIPQWFLFADVIGCRKIVESSFIVGIVLSLVVIALTIYFIRREYYLGGILAGYFIIAATSWGSSVLFYDNNAFEIVLFVLLPLFLEVGILVHWFVRMEHRIAYDPLLQIYNRDYCMKILEERSNVNVKPPHTIAMVDIDHFKKVNDNYGHQSGDDVLYHVAQIISKEVIPEGILCRYGGEEFAVFFPQKSGKDVKNLMEKARLTVEKTKISSGKRLLSVTVSCGISTREDFSQDMMKVLATADKALYRAKKGGRNQVKLNKTAQTEQTKKK